MTDETILAQLDALVALGLAMELERIKPEQPCRLCRSGDPCAWHRPLPPRDDR